MRWEDLPYQDKKNYYHAVVMKTAWFGTRAGSWICRVGPGAQTQTHTCVQTWPVGEAALQGTVLAQPAILVEHQSLDAAIRVWH